MKFVLVSTRNVQRFMDAAKALEKRLADSEIVGLGLVYGKPGLGKTMAMDAYHARQAGRQKVRTVPLRALAHWSESSMLKALLAALGHVPAAYRKDVMFDQIVELVKDKPTMFLIDEIDSIAGSRSMVATLKDLHDVTGAAILMVGEERVDGLLRRFESFYNRMNRSGIQHLTNHGDEDVAMVIRQRCDFEVAGEVCMEIYNETGGRSMRSVVDRIRDIEVFARANSVNRVEMKHYRQLNGARQSRTVSVPTQMEAVNG